MAAVHAATYFYAGSDALRVLHTFVFDGDESRDFIRGIGLRSRRRSPTRFTIATSASSASRTVCSAKPCAASPACGAIPATPRATRRSRGAPSPAIAPQRRATSLDTIPAFGDWTLLQPNADSFTIRKRTADGHAWLDADRGRRASRPRLCRRTRGRRRVRHPQFLAEPSRAARHSQAPPGRSRRDVVGVGARRHRRWTCASITMAWARTRTRSSIKGGSRSRTRTTSPASARRSAWRAPAS